MGSIREFKEYRSCNYEKTIKDAVVYFWDTGHSITQSLWPRVVFESERVGKWSLERINFPFLIFELMLSGELQYKTGGSEVVSVAGDLHITPAGSDVRVSSTRSRHCKRLGVELQGCLVKPLSETFGLGTQNNFKLHEPSGFEEKVSGIIGLLEEKKEGSEAAVSVLCYELLLFVSEKLAVRGKHEISARLGKVLNMIHSDLSATFSCEELANFANCSVPTLMRLFRDNLGQTPFGYINNYKMEQARQMLLKGDLSVKQIAAMLGFKNQFYFSRVFRKVYGIPPSAVERFCY